MSPDSRLGHLLWRYVELSFRHPWLILAAFLVLGGGAGWVASTLGFKGDFIELLPEKADEVVDLRFVEKRAGGGGYLVVQLTGGTRDERIAVGRELTSRLEAEKELVRYVEYHFDIDFFRERALLMLSTQKLKALEADIAARIKYEKAIANPLYVDLGEVEPPPDFAALQKKYAGDAPQSEYLESKDGKELYLYVKPTQLAADLDFNRRLIARARELAGQVLASRAGVKVDFTGAYVIRVEEDTVMQADLGRAAGLATLISLGIILLATRRLSTLVIVGAPVAFGIALAFAFARVLVGHLNPVTGFLGAILIGLGVEYGVHLSMRFREEREQLPPLEALKASVLGTFHGAMTSAFTNAAAFFVLVFAEFDAFKQFGKIAAFGVMGTVAGAYLMGPAILVIADRVNLFGRPHAHKPAPEGSVVKRRAIPVTPLVLTLLAILGFAGWSVSVAPEVGFETNLKNLKGESPATALDDHIIEQMGIIMTPALLYVNDLDDAREAADLAGQVSEAAGERTSFARVASLNDFVPWDADARLAQIAKIRKLVDDVPKSMTEGKKGERLKQFLELTEAKPWTVEDVPLEIRRRFSALEGGGTFVLIFPRYSGYDVAELGLWARDLNETMRRVHDAGIEAHVLDGNRIAARIFDLVKKDGPLIMALAALVVFAMIWLSLRSFGKAALVAGPLYVGFTCLFGAMHFGNVHLNFLNVVVLPNLLALAVDNSVHLYHRYDEEGPGSLWHVVKTTGFAAVVATATNAAGYGAMLVARHEGLRSIGVLAMLGVGCTFAGTTIFFPALLALLERFKGRKSAAA